MVVTWSVSKADSAPAFFVFSHHVWPMAMKKSFLSRSPAEANTAPTNLIDVFPPRCLSNAHDQHTHTHTHKHIHTFSRDHANVRPQIPFFPCARVSAYARQDVNNKTKEECTDRERAVPRAAANRDSRALQRTATKT